MDFIKSLLPPLKLPKLKKLKQWNGASILNLSQLTSLSSRTRNVGAVASVTHRSSDVIGVASIPNGTKGHARKRSDISIISASVPSSGGNGNFGLYALKCDRNAAKRGILLNLPRKMAAVVGGETMGCYQSEEMVHEKFSPCKKTVKPPPRKKKLRKRQEQHQTGSNPMKIVGREIYCGDRLLERNRSELFRIAERGSNEHLNRSYGEHLAPPAGALSSSRKARSVDNILAMKKYYPEEGVDSDSDTEQVRSLRVGRTKEWKRSRRLKYSESLESDSEEVVKVKKNVKGQLKKASDFSIDNNSDEIEVRFRRNESTESEELAKPIPLPLPTRVVVLRQEGVKPEVKPKMIKPKLPDKPPVKKVEQFVSSQDFADNFKPLASVLQESLKSADLKRKWINDFLSESDDGPVKPKQGIVGIESLPSTDSLSKKFELVDKFDRQLEALETGKKLTGKESVDSVNIFQKTNADFDEFDKLFNDNKAPPEALLRSLGSVKKNVTVSDRTTFINQQKTQLCFSSSSVDSDIKAAPVPPPLPPPVASRMTNGTPPKSTVNIQDYYDKKLQRVRYVSSPSPSRCFDEDSSTERTEAVNNNIVLPLSIINRTIVDNCITTEKVPKSATTEVTVNKLNQNIYPETYNQASNNLISCNLNNIDDPSYIGHNQANKSSANSHSHNVFIVGETFKRTESSEVVRSRKPTTVKRYINYKFDDFCHIGNGKGTKAPPRVFNINDFHDECYNEEGVVII